MRGDRIKLDGSQNAQVDVGRRPLWRRLGGAARRASHRILTAVDALRRRHSREILPPAHLRIYYYRTWNPDAFARARDSARTELVSRGLRLEDRVLDIGSGIGNLAMALVDAGHRGSYDGIEIHAEAVAWCQRAITTRHPHFRFHRADLASRAYNPRGRIVASEYRFPFPDESFDVVFVSSVFTHMLPDGVEQYLREISRVLAPRGMCVASYFLLNDESRAGVDAGTSFMSFDVEHPSGVCRLHEAAVVEAAVAFDEAFIRRAHDRAGLRIQDLRRGRWWSGVSDDQDVLTVRLNRSDPEILPSRPPSD